MFTKRLMAGRAISALPFRWVRFWPSACLAPCSQSTQELHRHCSFLWALETGL